MKRLFCSKALALFVVLVIVAQSVSVCMMTFAESASNPTVSETESILKAYPGAEGFGQTSKGGRGGQVYHVTNLEHDGEGSLTYGLEQVQGARTIVFDVGGVIDLTNLNRAIQLKGEIGSNVTVAGQTAPYPGITVKGYGFEIYNAHDIIIRNIRVRTGGVRSDDEYYVSDPLVIAASKRVIVDHCSMQWGVDNSFNITGEDITLSNNIFDKQLILNSSHEKGGHSYVGMVKEGSKNITFAKNFVGDSTQRSPRFSDVDCADVYNNLLYNCNNGIESYNYEFQNRNVRLNVYNNCAIMGPSLSNGTPFRVGRGRDYSGGVMLYFKGNYRKNSGDLKPKALNTATNYSNTLKTVLNFGSDNNMAGTDYDLSSVTFDEWNSNPASYDNNGKSSSAATLTYMEYPFAAPRAEVMDVVAEDGSNNLEEYAVDDNGMGVTRPARDLYDTMVMKEMQLGGKYSSRDTYSLKASLKESEVTPFFEELEKRTGIDYSEYKTAREWYVKQGDGPVLNGANSAAASTKPVRWDDYTDVNVNTNPAAASKYDSHYTTTFEVSDWWGEYCGAPGQVDGVYTAVGRTVADLYPDEWMQEDFPKAADAMDKYRTDYYSDRPDSASIVWDSVGDGIPDWYKTYRNLDIKTDYTGIVNQETGYTYLEEYLSLMAGDKETELAPVSIENFKAKSVSYSAAQVFWNTDCRASCTIEYGTEPGQYTGSQTLTYKNVEDGFDTYHVVALNRLEADTQYYYKVTATDENGIVTAIEYDANDETKSAMTFKTSPLPEGELLPNKPIITGVTPYTGQVEIRWSGNINDEAYEIYYDTEDHGCDYTEYAYKVADDIGAKDTAYTVTGLTDSTRYYFVVAAVNMYGKSPSASVSAVPERRFFHYDFTQMTEEQQTEFLKNEYVYDLGGSVSFQKDPDTGKNVLQLLDETNSHGVNINIKLPLVQDKKFTYEIKMKNLYQKQTDALNNQKDIPYKSADVKNYIQLNFYRDLLFEDGGSRKPSDLFDSAFDLRLEAASEPISVSEEGRFDGTVETGAIWLDNIEDPIGSYLPGRTQGASFDGEKVMPEGLGYPESSYKFTTAYGDAKYSNLADTDKTTHSIWCYEKGSAQYVTYRIVADPESSIVKVYADDVLLYDNKVSDFENIGKFQIKSRNDGYSWTDVESISVYVGEDRLNIPDLPPEPEHESTLIISGADGTAGDEVIMPVKIENNTGMAGFNIEMSYDNSKLIPTGIVQGTDLPGELKTELRVPGYVTAKWQLNQRAAGYDNDGELFMVKFKLTESVEQGEEIPISFSEVRIKDQYNNLIGVDKIGSTVSAIESTWSIKEYKDGKVVVTAPNNAAAVSNPSIYIAKYKDNGNVLDDMEVISVPVIDGKTVYELQTEKNLSAAVDSYVQLMLWDGNMEPLCSPLIERYTADQDGSITVSGVVTENTVTSINEYKEVDTSMPETITLSVSESTDTSIKEGSNIKLDIGETNAYELIGRKVSAQIVPGETASEPYTIKAINDMQGSNSVIGFTLDKFGCLEQSDKAYLCFENDSTDNIEKAALSDDVQIVYNHRHFDDYVNTTAAEKVFGSSGIIKSNPGISGEVTLVDNDNEQGYDVIFVNVAATAIINEIIYDEAVTFINVPGSKATLNNFYKIEFGNNYDSFTTLKMNGRPFDYRELRIGDTLSVVVNTSYSDVYYDVEVIRDNVISGIVESVSESETSADGLAYRINGKDYDMLEGCYTSGILRTGSEGSFYIDKYGKLAAFYKAIESENYGYITNGVFNKGNFGSSIISLQIVNKDGTVGAYDLADSVLVNNANDVIKSAVDDNYDEVCYKYADMSESVNQAFIDSIIGQVVTFNAANGIISDITLASENAYNSDITLALQKVDTSNQSEYDEKQMLFKCADRKYGVKDDTIVFYIGGKDDNFAYGQQANGYIDDFKVCIGEDLASVSGVSSAVYCCKNSNGDADVIVLYNTEPGVRTEYPDTTVDNTPGLACVISVNTQTAGESEVLAVDYLQHGERKTAVTSSADICEDLNKDTSEGSVFMFEVSDGIITSATPYLVFDGTVREMLSADESGIPKVKKLGTAESSDYDIYFGPAINMQDNSRLVFAPMNENKLPSLFETESISLSDDLTVYSYNPAANAGERVSVGSTSDVTVDKILTNNLGKDDYSAYKILLDGLEIDTPAWGMLDYVFIKKSAKKTEIVNYDAYEYYWDFERY